MFILTFTFVKQYFLKCVLTAILVTRYVILEYVYVLSKCLQYFTLTPIVKPLSRNFTEYITCETASCICDRTETILHTATSNQKQNMTPEECSPLRNSYRDNTTARTCRT